MGQITQGLAGFDCSTICAGGVRRVWITNADDVDSYTFGVDNEVTAIVMVVGPPAGVFYELEFKVNTKQFQQAVNMNEDGCGATVTQTLTGIASCYDQSKRTSIIEMAKQSCCGIVVIHQENSGFVGVWGFVEDLYARLGPGTATDTGANLSDPNQVTIELVCTTTLDGLLTEFTPGVAGVPV